MTENAPKGITVTIPEPAKGPAVVAALGTAAAAVALATTLYFSAPGRPVPVEAPAESLKAQR